MEYYTRLEIFNKFLEIKRDLIENFDDLYNRQKHFNHKYRGNIITDINVTIGDAENGRDKEIQIFIRNRGLYIKENIIYNRSGLFKSTIKSNLHE